MVSSKKDKPKHELDIEKNGTECTFKPNIEKASNIKDDRKISNDIYNEKSYDLMYKRLKKGRLDRQIKDSVHTRGNFPTEVADKASKQETITIPKTETIRKMEETNTSLPKQNVNTTMPVSVNTEENDIFRSDPDKKDSIPLLIIDVNIRPGVKKKIYVFDGDTAEGLAEKFALEHGM